MKEKLKLIVKNLLKKKRVIVPMAVLVIVGIAKASGHPVNEESLETFLNSLLDLLGSW
jgi:regulator of sigma D